MINNNSKSIETKSLEVIRLSTPERSRMYTFSNEETITFWDVTAITVSKSGTHRLETADGKKHIVPPKWLYITIEAESWSF